MGANLKSFEINSSSGPLGTLLLVIMALIGLYVAYKFYLYYKDRKKWGWFIALCKEKRLTAKEVTYLKNLVMRNKIKDTDDLFGSIYSMNLPSPIKKKLLFETPARSR